MNNTYQDIRVAYHEIEPFEDRVDILFRELELAVKWQRPSILLAIYSSEFVHTDAKATLKNRLIAMAQYVHYFQVVNDENSDIPLLISEIPDLDKTIFFIEGLRWGGGKDGIRAYRALSIGREYFIDKRIRAVFWLTENEANDLARYAPDFWAYRHRVIEFVEPPTPEQISLRALEATWQGIGEYADTLEDIDARIALREAMLNDLPEGDESIAIRGNLLFAIGVLHWRRGDYEKAIQFLQTALEIATYTQDKWFEAVCFNAVALVNTTLGRIDEAVESLKQAATLAPDEIFPWNNLGNLYSQLDRNDEAITALEKAIERNPLDAISWNGLGKIYQKLGRTDEAIATYQKAIGYAPNFAYPWIGLGDVFASTEHIEEAIGAFQKAIEINKRIVHPWISLGNIYEKQKRSEEAIKAYQKAFEIDPQNALIWNEQGNVYLNAGAYDEAINAYNKAIELDHGFGWPYCNLALAYSYKGKYNDVIPLYQKSIELFGNNRDKAMAWNRLGSAYRQLNDVENAIAAYQRAIELDPEETTFKKDLDEIHNDLSHFDEGLATNTDDTIAVDQRAVELAVFDPHKALFKNDPGVRHNGSGHKDEIGAAYNKANGINSPDDYGHAIVAYQRDAELAVLDPHNDSDRAFAWIDLGELHYDIGHLDEAIAANKEVALAAGQGAVEVFPGQAPVKNDPDAIYGDMRSVEEVAIPDDKKETAAPDQGVIESSQDMVSSRNDQGNNHNGSNHNNDEAIATYKKVTEINPQNARAWHTLGNLFRTSGRYSEAVSAFEQAVSLDPNKEVFHYHLGLVYAAQKRYDEAIRAFQKVVELNPEYNLAHCTLAGYYRRLGQENEAQKHIAIALPTVKDETEYNQACFAAICGNTDQAFVLLREALEKKQTTLDWVRRDPDFEFIHDDPRFKALVGE
jgi:tetratricopeptide (TPR) repeat protein